MSRLNTVDFTAEDLCFSWLPISSQLLTSPNLEHPLPKASGAASIVMMSSVSSMVSVSGVSIYVPTKGDWIVYSSYDIS